MSAWRGIAAPKGLPKDVDDQAGRRDQEDLGQQGVQGLRVAAGYGTAWAAQADFAKFMAKGDADMGVVMKAVGIAK